MIDFVGNNYDSLCAQIRSSKTIT